MKAVLIEQEGPQSRLRIGDVPMPDPGPEEIRVRIRATALNRADLLQRQGRYPPPDGAPNLLGMEMAGEVDACGDAVTTWKRGDRVFGLLPSGGYAGYCVLPERMAMAIPEGLTFEEAASIPEVYLTAFQALHWLGGLAAGERVLIHAGGSGVGTAAIQLTHAAGAHPYVTASKGKLARCRDLGAELAVDYRSESFADRIRAETGGEGVHLILDFIGAPYFETNVESLAVDGRLILLATLGGGDLKAFSLRSLFRKRASVIASTLRNRSTAYKIELTQAFAGHLLPLFASGRLRPVVDSVYPWTKAEDAHQHMQENRNFGKIVLRVDV